MQTLLAGDISLSKKITEAPDFTNTFTTTKKTKARSIILTKAYVAKDECVNFEHQTWETTCEDCTQDQICHTNDSGENECSYTWNCKTRACTDSWDVCTEWKTNYTLKDIKMILQFGNIFGPKAGHKIEVSLPSKSGEKQMLVKLDGKSCDINSKKNGAKLKVNMKSCK